VVGVSIAAAWCRGGSVILGAPEKKENQYIFAASIKRICE
jgi:hypothetical protein